MEFFLRILSLSSVGPSPEERQNTLYGRNTPILTTDAYRIRKQAQHTQRKNRLDSNGRYANEFRQILDLAALTAALDNLQGYPSSRSADAGSCTCSFPGDWDVQIEGHQFYWRDLYAQHASAVVWTSETAKKLIIGIKADENAPSLFGDHLLPYRRRNEYIRDAYVNPSIYRAAIEIYKDLSATGFFGAIRPMHRTNAPTDRRQEWSITLSGHHDGGAIAQVLGMILTEASYKAQVITFGAPKCVDTATAQRWSYRLPLLRIVNDGDIAHQLPVTLPDLIGSRAGGITVFNTPAHFGREIILRPEGHFIDQNSTSALATKSDSFWHQLFLRGFNHIRSRVRISHPMQYFDDPVTAEQSDDDADNDAPLDDYTDTLLLVLNRLELSKSSKEKLGRKNTQFDPARNRSDSLSTDLFDSSGNANQFARRIPHLLLLIVGAFFSVLFGYPLHTPALTTLDERIIDDPVFRRQQILRAYNKVYELGSDDPFGSSAAAPPSPTDHANPSADFLNGSFSIYDEELDSEAGTINLSPLRALEEHHDRRNRGIRCADCALFRKREFGSKSAWSYGAMIVYKDPMNVILAPFLRGLETSRKQKKAKRSTKSHARDPVYAAEAAKSLGSNFSGKSPRSPTGKGNGAGTKRKTAGHENYIPAQRQAAKEWARYRMVA